MHSDLNPLFGVCVCTNIHICVCVCICQHRYMNPFMYMYVCILKHVYFSFVNCASVCFGTSYIHVYPHINMSHVLYINTYICTYIHTHTHTHTYNSTMKLRDGQQKTQLSTVQLQRLLLYTLYTHILLCVMFYSSISTHTYTHTHTFQYQYTHRYIHTYVHTYNSTMKLRDGQQRAQLSTVQLQRLLLYTLYTVCHVLFINFNTHIHTYTHISISIHT
jgi:hypothetical protein